MAAAPAWFKNRLLLFVAIVAAIVYCSWPLGYVLTPQVAAHGLASDLEALHQPYNWLFIGADIVSSLLIMAVVCHYWWRSRQHKQLWLQLVAASVISFGIATIIDALLPVRCNSALQICPNYTQDHFLLLHGIFSITASVGLFVSLAVLWLRQRRSILLNTVLLGYLVFGVLSMVTAVVTRDGIWAQHYYIALCSAWIALLPIVIVRNLQPLKKVSVI